MAESNATPSRLRQFVLTADGSLDLLRLRFVDPDLETSFHDSHYHRALPVIRIALLLGVVLVTAFALLDLIIVGEQILAVYLIRFGVICPTLLGLFLVTFTSMFRRLMQTTMMCAMLIVGAGVVAMTGFIDAPGSYLYYAGILDTVIYCCCVMRLRFFYALFVSVVLFAAYQFTAIVWNPIPAWALLSNNFFFVTAVGVGAFAAYVQEYYLRVAHHNEQLVAAERDRSQQLLAKARAASQAKSDFLAMISHELRTPLNAIIGFSEMMGQEMFGPLGDKRYKAYVEDIHGSGNHLLDVINDILDLSKAESGRLDLHEENIDLASLVETVVRLIREKALQKEIALDCNLSTSLPMLRGDRSMLTRVVLNLLSNATKFTEPGGQVSVTLKMEDDGQPVLTIRDTGIGIAPNDLKRVMEPFLQADTSLARKHEGTGLGLPLSRKMVELHGGTLVLDSVQGAGTTVRVCLPAARVVGSYAPAASAAAAE